MEPPETVTSLPDSLTSQLALEVYNIVLGNFSTSKEDLATFSLVCKSWLPLCRYYLFAEVDYRPDFACFLATSTHAFLTVAPHIRRVTLRGHHFAGEAKHDLWLSILALPGLVSLHFENFDSDNLSPLISIPFTPQRTLSPRLLSILSLRSIRFTSFLELVKLLHSLTALQELSLDNVSWGVLYDTSADIRPIQDSPITASFLRNLRVGFCNNRAFLNWFCYGLISDDTVQDIAIARARTFPDLAAISLPDILLGEVDILGAFLEALGESLEFLETGILGHNFDDLNHDALMRLHLSKNTNLKQVVIRGITLFHFPSLMDQSVVEVSRDHSEIPVINSSYTWIANFISSARPHSHLSIDFHIWLSAEDQLEAFPWSSLSNALSNIEVSHIRFHISGVCRDMELVKTWFTKRLPTIDTMKTAMEFEFCV